MEYPPFLLSRTKTQTAAFAVRSGQAQRENPRFRPQTHASTDNGSELWIQVMPSVRPLGSWPKGRPGAISSMRCRCFGGDAPRVVVAQRLFWNAGPVNLPFEFQPPAVGSFDFLDSQDQVRSVQFVQVNRLILIFGGRVIECLLEFQALVRVPVKAIEHGYLPLIPRFTEPDFASNARNVNFNFHLFSFCCWPDGCPRCRPRVGGRS